MGLGTYSKKQKALEPKTSKKTNSSRAEKKVYSIDNSSNRDIEEGGKKAYNYENEFVVLRQSLFQVKKTATFGVKIVHYGLGFNNGCTDKIGPLPMLKLF